MENMRRWLPPGVSRGWGPQSDSHKELKSASERHEAGSRVLPGSSRKDLSPADGHLPFRHPKLTTHLSHAVSRADKWPQRPRCKEADGRLPLHPFAGSALFRQLGALAGDRAPWPTAAASHLPHK